MLENCGSRSPRPRRRPADGTATTLGLEQKIQDDPQLLGSAPQTYTYLAREYIWGPGDGPSGVDELLCQYASDRSKPWWTLQDAGGDIVAICDQPSPGYSARVNAQYTYDAYGAVNTAEHLVAHPYLHAGHKALFNDRLDVGTAPSIGGGESPRLVPYAHAVYQVRNRAYAPAMGRFFQRDPNAAALNLIETSAYHGRGLSAIVSAFSMEEMYGDEANLYQYLGSNPWTRDDPLGTSWDPFDMVDEILAERMGSASALLSALGQSARFAAVITATIASYLPFPVANLAGEMALVALGEESMDDMATGVAVGLIPGGKLLGGLGKAMSGLGRLIGNIGSSAWSGAKHYAGKFIGPLADRVGGLFGKALGFLRKECGCFESDTPVWTMRGQVPIAEIRIGDLVIAQDAASGKLSLRRVVSTFTRDGAPIVSVVLTGATGEQTLDTTEEHPFYVEGLGWIAAQSLRHGQVVRGLSGPATVIEVSFGRRQAAVYNIEVEGLHDYHVGADGFLVHNRGACHLFEFHHFLPKQHWKRFKRWFSESELDALGQDVSRDWHKRIHGKGTGMESAWNNRWETWLDANERTARREDVLGYLDVLKIEFGLNIPVGVP